MKDRIALQVYSVRDDMKRDFYGTLKKVKEMGYSGVEFAGLYGHDPLEVRTMCEELGLVPLSAYVPFVELMDHMDESIACYKTLGVKYVVVPYLTEEYRPGTEGKFAYFGRGPLENYCDMHLHTTTGWFESDTGKEYVPYVMPQEHGNHTACKVLQFQDGLTFKAKDTFEINVSDYSSETLTKAAHTDELQPNGMVNVRIDYKNSGVGSNSCGPALMEKYRVGEKEFSFAFDMIRS